MKTIELTELVTTKDGKELEIAFRVGVDKLKAEEVEGKVKVTCKRGDVFYVKETVEEINDKIVGE